MADEGEKSDRLRTARRLRRGARVAFGLWAFGWLVFALVVGTGGRNDLVSALAVMICALFAVGVILEWRARSLEIRELVAEAARSDLTATRSRGLPRVR